MKVRLRAEEPPLRKQLHDEMMMLAFCLMHKLGITFVPYRAPLPPLQHRSNPTEGDAQ